MEIQPTERPSWTWKAMGTTWRIFHSGLVDEQTASLVAAQVEADEARWSRFRPGSEVSRLNRAAGRSAHVSAETFELLQECDRWSRRTGGVFCPLAGGAVQAWGYEASIRERAPGTAVSPEAQPQPSDPLVVDERERTARVPAGARLDLGGIAKMWSAARAGALLRRRSADPFLLVDAGGDMVAARGEHVVIVEDPADPGGAPLTCVRVAEGSGVATSGWTRRHWRNGDGREAHHIIDPQLGEPAPRAQATVVADEPVAAEVLAKVVVLRPDALTQIDAAALRVNGSGAVPNERWKVLAQ